MTKSEAAKLAAPGMRATHALNLETRIQAYNQNPKLCKQCSNPIDYFKRVNDYCCRSCSATANNSKFPKRAFKRVECKNCSKKCRKGFCNVSCKTEHSIKNGTYKNRNCTNEVLRKYLLRYRDHRCEECKLDTWNNKPIPLSVHHKDGNASNNALDNLQLLCYNCHGLTENFGRKNKNSARKARYAL